MKKATLIKRLNKLGYSLSDGKYFARECDYKKWWIFYTGSYNELRGFITLESLKEWIDNKEEEIKRIETQIKESSEF